MPAYTTPHNIEYPTAADLIKSSTSESALADDFKALADTAQTALTQESQKFNSALRYVRDLATGENLDDLRTPGIYGALTTPIAASLVNSPMPIPGVYIVAGPASGTRSQDFIANTGESLGRAISVATGLYGKWDQKDGRGRVLPNGTNLPNFLEFGDWRIPSTASAATMIGLPSDFASQGTLINKTFNGLSATHRILFGLGESLGVWYQAMDVALSVPGNYVWSAWVPLHGGGSGASSTEAGAAHASQKRKASLGRGGPIGTAGKAVGVIRVDHNNKLFQEILLPLLRARALPASMCQFVDVFDRAEYTGSDVSTGYGWADVEAAALVDGIELVGHGWTHMDGELNREIVDSKTQLEALTNLRVPTLMVPGVLGTKWGGFSDNLADPDVFHNTEAGRLVMSTYAGCDGHGALLWPMGTGHTLGFPSVQVDTHTTSDIMIGVFKKAQLTSGAAVMMIHPNMINNGAGFITTAVLTEILDWMVAERDAGRLEILTATGMLHADPERTTRNNLVRDPKFTEGLGRWVGSAGYTVAGDVASGNATSGLLAQSISMADVGWAAGYSRMLTAQFRSTAGAVVRVRVSDSGNPANWDASRDVTIPAGGAWVTVRQPTTIPASGTDTFKIEAGRVSGGAIDVRRIGLEAV